ncbi:MAG: DUF3039 domain-containing protein [Cellulomonadaceae bacterium]|nr:DUF3039 domain-containing protein [Cellulomonadaceae bacterium]
MAGLGAPEAPTAPSGGTAVMDRPDLDEFTDTKLDDGDHDRFAHYVRKQKIVESQMTGKPVIALCGKVWVPGRDPKKYPVCPMCKEIYDGLRGPNDGGSGSDGAGGSGAGGTGGGSGSGK